MLIFQFSESHLGAFRTRAFAHADKGIVNHKFKVPVSALQIISASGPARGAVRLMLNRIRQEGTMQAISYRPPAAPAGIRGVDRAGAHAAAEDDMLALRCRDQCICGLSCGRYQPVGLSWRSSRLGSNLDPQIKRRTVDDILHRHHRFTGARQNGR